MFSCEYSKISKNTFFTEHLRMTASTFNFSEAATKCSMKKSVLENFAKFTGKHLLFTKFPKTSFYGTPLDYCFLLFHATLLIWGTPNIVWKTSDEYSLSRNINLRSTVHVYHFFFWQDKLSVYVFIGLHCLLTEAAIRE